MEYDIYDLFPIELIEGQPFVYEGQCRYDARRDRTSVMSGCIILAHAVLHPETGEYRRCWYVRVDGKPDSSRRVDPRTIAIGTPTADPDPSYAGTPEANAWLAARIKSRAVCDQFKYRRARFKQRMTKLRWRIAYRLLSLVTALWRRVVLWRSI